MGFLKIFGRALQWEESKQFLKIIKDNAADKIMNLVKPNKCYCPKFGYEFEFHKIYHNDQKQKIQIDLQAQDDIIKLNSTSHEIETAENGDTYHLQFEYGRWMIEAIPTVPLAYLEVSKIEQSVEGLYSFMDTFVGKGNYLSLSSFPVLGVGNEYFHLKDSPLNNETSTNANQKEDIGIIDIDTVHQEPESEHVEIEVKEKESEQETQVNLNLNLDENPYSQSNYIHDVIINTHPRFGTLSRNIRQRRGKKVEILVPITQDIRTNITEPTIDEPFPGYVYMDAMAFGMGCCCVQVTLGSCSMNSSKYLYDQMLPLCPILLAVSSSSPVYKGKLTDYDNRFDIISQSVDDRTDDERDANSPNYVYKSRYSPSYCYVSDHVYSQEFNNDYPKFPINLDYYEQFVSHGLSKKLAEHFCNILVRDPMVIFENKIQIEDKADMSHFECMNSTNWNSLRLKPPRAEDNDTCFKIEVRPCDLQISPFENTAVILLILSLFGSMISYDVNFIIPISKVDENFQRAYKADSILTQKFWWRINGIDNEFKPAEHRKNKFLKPFETTVEPAMTLDEDMKNIKELTIKEIFWGCHEYNYPGLLEVCYRSLSDFFIAEELYKYIDFIGKRASGELWTDAKYIRKFIMNHPKYQQDSIVSEEINYDLINHLLKIQNKEIFPSELFGHFS